MNASVQSGVADQAAANAAQPWNILAATETNLSSIRSNIQAALNLHMIQCGQSVGGCVQSIIDVLEGFLQSAAVTCGGCANDVCQTLQSHCDASCGVIGLCNARINRCCKGSTKPGPGVTMPAADAGANGEAGQGPQSSPTIGPLAQSPGATATVAPSFGPDTFNYAAASQIPPAGQLAVAASAAGNVVDPATWPAALWDPKNSVGIWLSTQLTPLTIAGIATIATNGEPGTPAAPIWVNSASPVPQGAALSLSIPLDIDAAAITEPDRTTAYSTAVQFLGAQTVNAAYQANGIPIPGVPGAMPAASGGGSGVTTPQTPPNANGGKPGDFDGDCQPCIPICGMPPEKPVAAPKIDLALQFAAGLANAAGGAPINVIPGLPPIPNPLAFLDPANWPTLCDLARRLGTLIGIDASRLWPCVPVNVMMDRFYGR